MKTLRFHIAQADFVLGTKIFALSLVPVNNLVPMKYCPGQGCKVGLISRRPYINIVLFYFYSIFLSHNSFE